MPTYTPEQETESRDLLAKGNALLAQGQQAINSQSLAPTPQFKLPETTPNATEAPAFGNYLEEYSKQFGVDDAQKGRDTSLQSYLGSLLNTEGETALTSKAYESGGVDTLNLELKDLNNQLLGEQRALQKEVESIEKNPEGVTLAAMQDRVGDARTASLRRQSDIAVIQMAKQNQYDSAKTIADRAISAQLERQKQKNDILQFIYSENKELFTKKEARAFEAAQADRSRALDREERDLKQISDLSLNALKNGAPSQVASQMRAAKTVEDAINIGGRYIDKYDRALQQLQIENIRSQISERDAVLTGPRSAITGKPLSAEERKALGFAERTMSSSLTIDEIGSQFAGAFSQLPLPNLLKGADRQRFEQAQRNFVNAVLRRESGAVISEEEFANARLQYFPQPGDKSDVLVQKKMNRDQVIKNLLIEGGQDTTIQDASLADPLGIGIQANNPLGI